VEEDLVGLRFRTMMKVGNDDESCTRDPTVGPAKCCRTVIRHRSTVFFVFSSVLVDWLVGMFFVFL
jgi:hypothetical protein